jgi:tRNA(Ile2) C34 agmatinyltransferase TiaS
MRILNNQNLPICPRCNHRQDPTKRIVYKHKRCAWCGYTLKSKREMFVEKVLKLLRVK